MTDEERGEGEEELIEDLEAPVEARDEVVGGAARGFAEPCLAGSPTCYRYSCSDTAVFCGNPQSDVKLKAI